MRMSQNILRRAQKTGAVIQKNFFKPCQNTKSNGNLADENRIKTQNH